VDTALEDKWLKISAGIDFTCAISEVSVAFCWGSDAFGRLGNGATTGTQASPSAVDITGSIPDTWKAISAGESQACAVGADDTAWCWGSDSFGALGNGSTLGDSTSPSPVDTTDPIPDTWIAVSAGTFFSCGIAADGSGWCWGDDGHGQLGNGATLTGSKFSPSPIDTTDPIPDTWSAISVGNTHACALANDDSLWCWGSDDHGRLGNGSTLTADQVSPSGPVVFPSPPGPGPADIQVTKTDAPDPVAKGQFLTYTITVTNLTAANGTGVITLTDALPAGTGFASITGTFPRDDATGSEPGPACTTPQSGVNGTVTCTGALDASGGTSPSATFTLVVRVGKLTTSGSIVNTVNVSLAGDPDTDNNQAQASTSTGPPSPTTTNVKPVPCRPKGSC
jgi:uncharacterized repeat protein (TIGR01451 family)